MDFGTLILREMVTRCRIFYLIQSSYIYIYGSFVFFVVLFLFFILYLIFFPVICSVQDVSVWKLRKIVRDLS